MTTFQALITGLVYAFSEILPVGSDAHAYFLTHFLGWAEPGVILSSAIHLGLVLALIGYFRHDFLSFMASFIQVILFRKKPTSIDERMPFFILISALFPMMIKLFFRDFNGALTDQPIVYGVLFALSGLPLWFFDAYTRKNKSFYDWGWIDSIILGIGQCSLLFPWLGRSTGALTFSAIRNFSKEGAAKFILYSATLILTFNLLLTWRTERFATFSATEEITKLTFWTTALATGAAGIFFIHHFMKQLPKAGLGRYGVYRILVGAAVIGFALFR